MIPLETSAMRCDRAEFAGRSPAPVRWSLRSCFARQRGTRTLPGASPSGCQKTSVPPTFVPQRWVPRLVAAWLIAVCLVLVACAETVAIGRLLSDPAHWNNKEVHIQGHVTNSMGMMGEGAYRLDDGTGSIWVISNTGIPSRGASVDVIGTVFQGAEFMGHSYGVALRERGHRSR